MATNYIRVTRTALKGVHLVTGRWLISLVSTSCGCSRLLHVCPAVFQVSSSQSSRSSQSTVGKEEPETPQYNSKKKPKNPMVKVGYAWMIGLPSGIIGFLLAKRQVDKNRLKQLKIRQRMRTSNDGV